jgi:hypothetical protein
MSRQGWPVCKAPSTAEQLKQQQQEVSRRGATAGSEGSKEEEVRRGAVRRTRKPAGGTGKMMTRA